MTQDGYTDPASSAGVPGARTGAALPVSRWYTGTGTLTKIFLLEALALAATYIAIGIAVSEGAAGRAAMMALAVVAIPIWVAFLPVNALATLAVGRLTYLGLSALTPPAGVEAGWAAYGAIALAVPAWLFSFRLERRLARNPAYHGTRHALRLAAVAAVAYSQLLKYEGHTLTEPLRQHIAAFRANSIATLAVVIGVTVVVHFVLPRRTGSAAPRG